MINYEIKLVNKTVNFLRRIITKTYQITKIIFECGVVSRIKLGVVTIVVALGITFGHFGSVKPIVQSPTQIDRQIEHSRLVQPYQVASKSSTIRNLLKLSGGELGKGSGPGPRTRNDALKANATTKPKAAKSKPGGSSFVQAWTQSTSTSSRPAAVNRLAQQLQTGPAEGSNGLFGRFSARPTPHPSNPGCANRPESITILGQSKSSEQDSVREIIAHDGVKGKLTDKSTNHLTSKHGDVLGIDDPLPSNPNQKPTEYKKTRTRINKENKKKFGDTVEEILKDPNTEPYPDISIRGIKGHGYYTKNYGGVFVGIHTEGEFKGQIKKAQPISQQQLTRLQEEDIID